MIYLDSAILVKLYIKEPDSEHWREVLASQTLVTSSLAQTELKSAFRQKVRQGFLKPRFAEQSWAEFRAAIDAGAIQAIPLGSDVVDEAVRILDTLPRSIALRTLDSLHLATAHLIGSSSLATTDHRMLAGAKALGIPLV